MGALALAGLVWYLSKDDETLDYSKFNKAKLEVLMKEMELEITCIYARNYNIMLDIKADNEWDD